MVVATALYVTAITVSEQLAHTGLRAPPLSLINATGLLAMALTVAVARLGLAPHGPAATASVLLGAEEAVGAAPPAEAPRPADAAETALLDRLLVLMAHDRIY